MSETHPAVLARENSGKFTMAGDRESWLGLFVEDAFLANPVGRSPFDPKGEGFRGKAGLKRYWDTVLGRTKLTIVVKQQLVSDNACACVLETTIDFGGGATATVDSIGIYEVNDDGKLVSVKVYWDWDALLAQVKELGLG
jgi:steroid delta-isomerase